MSKLYSSSFNPSLKVTNLLYGGQILDARETPADMVDRVVTALGCQELRLNHNKELALSLIQQFGAYIDAGLIVLSTPILTNAGRYKDKPLSACIMPPISLKEDISYLREKIDELHQQGMGTGFNLSDMEDPVKMLRVINNISVNGADSGNEDRPVGNMAILSVYHPKIMDFIDVKRNAARSGERWKFNISVDLDQYFFDQLQVDGHITLRDGSPVKANHIFDALASAAHSSADPGVIFLDRMNMRNPLPGLGEYKTTAPCAEVGLVEGEACQFGYLNIGNFIKSQGPGDLLDLIDFDKLKEATSLLTRFLDNALEISISNYASSQTAEIMRNKRKIGVGICGLADALTKLGLAYASEESRKLMRDVLAFINYTSKLTSVQLAKERGSFEAINLDSGNRYAANPGFVQSLYGQAKSQTVSSRLWKKLEQDINKYGIRNSSTVALPPTGRSALIFEASPGIEPHFTLDDMNTSVSGQALYNVKNKKVRSQNLGEYLAIAKDIDPIDHIAMISALQTFTDEAISKTINLPEHTSLDEVKLIYKKAWENKLIGATLYIDNTHIYQPRTL